MTTDLRALLGDDRYDEVIERAGRATLAADPFANGAWDDLSDVDVQDYRDLAAGALAAVLPDLLAAAWDEGHDAGFYARERWCPLGDSHDASESHAANPYRTEESR